MDRKDELLYFRALMWLGFWTYTIWREVGSGLRIGMEDAGWSPMKPSYTPVPYDHKTTTDTRGW